MSSETSGTLFSAKSRAREAKAKACLMTKMTENLNENGSKLESSTARRIPPNAGMGRPKGSQNKFTREVKEMILEALDNAGGVDYLAKQAEENPTAFMTLVGKVLPMQVNADVGGKLIVEWQK